MNRRDTLLALLAIGATVVPVHSYAQQAGHKLWRIGVLTPSPDESKPGDTSDHGAAFVGEMQAAGYTYGVDYVLDLRSADGDEERMAAQARELVRLNMDIIIALAPPAVNAAHKATKTIPIVCIAAHDPVGLGMAASLARPGGNLTGLASFYGDLIPKHLELLKSIAPKVSRVALLVNPTTRGDPNLERKVREAAEMLGLRTQLVAINAADQLPHAFATMSRERAGAFIAVADSIVYKERQRVAELALKHRLPSVFATRENVQAGGLLSYGEDFVEMFAHAGKYVSKIMKGAKPGDLPIEQPTKLQLAINRRTAKALKLTIPQALLLRADMLVG